MSTYRKSVRMAYQERLATEGRCTNCSRPVEPVPGKKRKPVTCALCRAKANRRAQLSIARRKAA